MHLNECKQMTYVKLLLLHNNTSVVYNCWVLTRTRNTYIYINIVLFFYSTMLTLVWSSRVIRERESACTKGLSGVGFASAENSQHYIVLQLPRNYMQCLFPIDHSPHPCNACLSLVTAHTHMMLAFLWPQPTSTRCLPFSGHSPHPRDACLSLATPYIHAMLVSGIILMILPMARCICQQHPPGSLQVKVIYYTRNHLTECKQMINNK